MSTTGRCLCGAVSYTLEGDPIATAVCHCDHCQRQGGSAFSVNVIAAKAQVTVKGELSTYEDCGDSGDEVFVYRRFCGACGSPIYSEMIEPAGVVALKAGTLDDRNAVKPTIEAWCDHRQPWVELPEMDVQMATE